MVLTQRTKMLRHPQNDSFRIEYRSRKEWVLHDKFQGDLQEAKAYFKYTSSKNSMIDWQLRSSVGVVCDTKSDGLQGLI